MTYSDIMGKVNMLSKKTNAELPAAIRELSDIFMQYALTPKQARELMNQIDKVCPPDTESGRICNRTFIETGVGESMEMLMTMPDDI